MEGMAILINEWGTTPMPPAAPHLMLQGVAGVDAATRTLGKGLTDTAAATAELLDEQEQVTGTGELAGFAARLRSIGQETREVMAARRIRDWDAAWQQASEPLLLEAVNELPENVRDAGRELARAYNAQEAVRARREYELSRIETARMSWQGCLDNAVQSGDTPALEAWLQAGRGVFVAEDNVEPMRRELRSRSCLAQWQQRLQQEPLEALAALAGDDARPERAQDARALEQAAASARRAASGALARRWQQALEQGLEPDADSVDRARAAGLVPAAAETAPQPMTPREKSEWLGRIDERDDADEQPLRLQIALAPLPVQERNSLLQRMDATCAIPADDRRRVSLALRRLYRRGVLGCPGDATAHRRLSRLQEEALPILQQGGAAAAERWVGSLPSYSGRWVCFRDMQQKGVQP